MGADSCTSVGGCMGSDLLVDPDSKAGDIWRESWVFVCVHGLIIRYGQLSCQYCPKAAGFK
jgi:hypothetical protein